MLKVDGEGKIYLVCHFCSKEFNAPGFDSANPFNTIPVGWIGILHQERGVEFYCDVKECTNCARTQLDLELVR